MKTTRLVILMTLLALNINFSKADVILFSSPTACSNLSGRWLGEGTVTADIIIKKITCTYKGEGMLTQLTPSTFIIDMALSKDSGICPDHEQYQLNGTCRDGLISLTTQDANLSGSLNDQGTAVDAQGTVKVKIGGVSVQAKVEHMHLEKQ